MTPQDLATLTTQLRRDEGLRLRVYDDATGQPIAPGSAVKGHPTIGYGRALDVRGISSQEADYLLSNDVQAVIAQVQRALPWSLTLSAPRFAVLVNMAFNLGLGGLLSFNNTLAKVQAGDYAGAAQGMLASLWAKQVGARAQRLAAQMQTGVWQ